MVEPAQRLGAVVPGHGLGIHAALGQQRQQQLGVRVELRRLPARLERRQLRAGDERDPHGSGGRRARLLAAAEVDLADHLGRGAGRDHAAPEGRA